MNPGNFNFTLRSNTTFSQPITYESGGSVVDLSGYTAKLQISSVTGTPVYELTTANGGITLAATAPNITWNISTSTIATIPAGGYVYDFVLWNGAGFTGTELCLLQGGVSVVEGITS